MSKSSTYSAMKRCILRKEEELSALVSNADANLLNVTALTLQSEHIINPKNFILAIFMLFPKWVYSLWLISLFLYRALELYLIEKPSKFSLKILISRVFCKYNYLNINILSDVFVKNVMY
jgi:hypothetical protein